MALGVIWISELGKYEVRYTKIMFAFLRPTHCKTNFIISRNYEGLTSVPHLYPKSQVSWLLNVSLVTSVFLYCLILMMKFRMLLIFWTRHLIHFIAHDPFSLTLSWPGPLHGFLIFQTTFVVTRSLGLSNFFWSGFFLCYISWAHILWSKKI